MPGDSSAEQLYPNAEADKINEEVWKNDLKICL